MADFDSTSPSLIIISLKSAKASGALKYFTGVPCRRGHIAERYVSCGACVACSNKPRSERSYRKASEKKYREANKEKRKAWKRKYKEANPEKVRAQRKINGATARAKARAEGRKRVSRRHRFTAEAFDLIVLQKGKCAICKVYLSGKFHIDHIVPLSLGGSDSKKNIQLLCVTCNLKKGTKPPDVIAAELGRLI